MSPFEKAARVYIKEPCARPLGEDLEHHLLNGYVFNTPDVFLMARRVNSCWDDSEIKSPWRVDPDGDTWHVWLAGGDLHKGLHLIPYSLPWLSWERGNRVRFRPYSTVIRRIGRR